MRKLGLRRRHSPTRVAGVGVVLDPVEHQIASGGLEPVDGIDGHRVVADQDFRGAGFGVGRVRPSLNSSAGDDRPLRARSGHAHAISQVLRERRSRGSDCHASNR
jgi:hypothetical protein